jgi:hypothetical protein
MNGYVNSYYALMKCKSESIFPYMRVSSSCGFEPLKQHLVVGTQKCTGLMHETHLKLQQILLSIAWAQGQAGP